MARGKNTAEGTRRQAPNGYWYIKKDGEQRLLHHVIAERILHRPIDTSKERVSFLDGDRNNLAPSNIVVRPKGQMSLLRRKAHLEHRIEELQHEVRLINKELGIVE